MVTSIAGQQASKQQFDFVEIFLTTLKNISKAKETALEILEYTRTLMRFTNSYGERAIQLKERDDFAVREKGVGIPKRFVQSIIMKKLSFDALKIRIYKVVDKRLELLTKIARVSSKMIEKVVDYIRNEAGKRYDAQI